MGSVQLRIPIRQDSDQPSPQPMDSCILMPLEADQEDEISAISCILEQQDNKKQNKKSRQSSFRRKLRRSSAKTNSSYE